ncbi:hypothetical protein MJO28_001592 [Puccinia striiformis f. sp. tritici]|uniref:Uncharacterized protein n=1 Tax=Puccinia striiformis f. sp. tritici TaxID=168172 RepID=A0ACC0EXG1_9BASI|nr:hypothetical protein MJO28_017482 [Puccinia striiformis f. sp. tritici]KAI7961103.1 hypothetical protein MJO28_001592 [Puccinia striiformis f. sp. tritici]
MVISAARLSKFWSQEDHTSKKISYIDNLLVFAPTARWPFQFIPQGSFPPDRNNCSPPPYQSTQASLRIKSSGLSQITHWMQLPNVVVFEDGKVSFFVGTILMTAILGANLGLFIRYWQCHKYHPLLLNISVSALVVVATAYVSMSQYAMWIWFIDPLNVESGYALWPYAISPLLSGALIWSVSATTSRSLATMSNNILGCSNNPGSSVSPPFLTPIRLLGAKAIKKKTSPVKADQSLPKLYALSDQRFRVITVLLICLTFAQLVLCAEVNYLMLTQPLEQLLQLMQCRTMEILGIRADSFTSTRTSGPYVFPIWLTFVSLANSILNMLLFQVLNRLKFRFEMSTNLWEFFLDITKRYDATLGSQELLLAQYNRFIILAPQTHLIAGLLCQLDMALFMLKKLRINPLINPSASTQN